MRREVVVHLYGHNQGQHEHWSGTDVLEHTSEEVTSSRIPTGPPRRRNLQELVGDGHGDGHTSGGDGHTSIVESHIRTFGKTSNGG